MKNGLMDTYTKVGIETGVAAASPHQLIVMLFEGALTSIAVSRRAMKLGLIAEKGEAISRAINIIEGLNASLNMKNGGEIAANLTALYEYMCRKLIEANFKNEPETLEEVGRLLSEIKGAWKTIGNQANPAAREMALNVTQGGHST